MTPEISTLIECGVSKTAATVYLALLEVSPCTVTALQEKTKLHPQLIYNALRELKNTELCEEYIERGRKHFRVNSPEVLAKVQRERLLNVETLLPSLLEKFSSKEQGGVRVVMGTAELQKARLELLNAIPNGETYYVIGDGGKKFKQALEGTYTEQEEERIARGVHKKIIDFRDTFKERGVIKHEELTEQRILTHVDGGPISTVFGGSMIRLTVWSDPILSVIITNDELVESYRRYFTVLWHQAKPADEVVR